MNMERYSRQILFSPIGEEGQKRLSESSVLLVGAGALGSVISNHLVRSGIGRVKIVDRDFVEKSNLQRQSLYTEEDAEKTVPKAVAAENILSRYNKEIKVEGIVANVSVENIDSLLASADLVMDGTDNFSTRYLLNDICYQRGIPFSYAGVVSSRGMTGLFIPGKTPCLRCMIPLGQEAGETCDTIGVLSPAVDIIASYQTVEVIKYLTGNHGSLTEELRTLDIWQNYTYAVKLQKARPDCPTCQKKEYPSLQRKAGSAEVTMCGRNTVQIHRMSKIDLPEAERKLSRIVKVKRTPFLLKAVLENDMVLVLFPDGRVLIQGTEDVDQARTLYDRYVGS